MSEFADVIKMLAAGVQDSSRPVNVLFGIVQTPEPDISVLVEQKKLLTKEFLVLTRNVTDYNVDMTVDHMTEDTDTENSGNKSGGAGDASFASHNHSIHHKHPYKGRKTFLVHKKLLAGEKVLLISLQGGQSYVIIDRVGSNIGDTNS